MNPQFDTDLKALADKYQVHIKGTATPVNPEVDAFDITAEATVATPAPDQSAETTPPAETVQSN